MDNHTDTAESIYNRANYSNAVLTAKGLTTMRQTDAEVLKENFKDVVDKLFRLQLITNVKVWPKELEEAFKKMLEAEEAIAALVKAEKSGK